MGSSPTPASWTPPAIVTVWDDLLAGVGVAQDWPARRAEIRRRFLDLLRDDERPSPVPAQPEVEREWRGDGFTVRRISYSVEREERARAFLAIPDGPRPPGGFPAVLCLQGTTSWGARQTLGIQPDAGERVHGPTTISGKDYARELVRAGFVTLSPEHFNCGARTPAEGFFDTAAFYRRHPRWTAVGKSTYESRVALDVLEAWPGVDATRLGVTGFSLGGTNSMTIAALDDRVACAVPMGAAMAFRSWETPLEWSRDRWYVYFPQLRDRILAGERIACDQHEWLALIAPRPCLEIFATDDTSPLSQAHRVQMHLRLAELWRLLGNERAHAWLAHGDGHSITALTRAAQLRWFERWLRHGGDPCRGIDERPTPGWT